MARRLRLQQLDDASEEEEEDDDDCDGENVYFDPS
jgi:hypothetical protein